MGTAYCLSRGGRIISLDTREKIEHFLGVVSGPIGSSYFWTGGMLSEDKTKVHWDNGNIGAVVRGKHPWSFGGLRGPQPDGIGSEDCVAVLNNFYNDGAKFHDVGCEHQKGTICEL